MKKSKEEKQMKSEKTTPKLTKKKKSTKPPENPADMRAESPLLQNDTDVFPISGKNTCSQPQCSCGFKPSFHHDPSLPISVSIPLTSGVFAL